MKNTKTTAKYETVGEITVDAGIVQVGDPCYGNRNEFEKHEDWIKYLEENKIFGMGDSVAIPHDRSEGTYGECAKAVVVSSGFGDGVYPVQIKRCPETGRVKELRVKFF